MSVPVQAAVSSTRPSLPVSRVTIDGKVRPEALFVELKIEKNINRHDSASVVVLWPDTNMPEIERKTISFTYGSGNDSETFHGYVYSTTKSQEFQKQTITTMTCLGVTWPMRNVTPRVFSQRTGASMLAEILRPHKLGLSMEDDAHVFPRVAQTSQTDWELVTEIAYMMGMHAVSFNGVVRLVNAHDELMSRLPKKRLIKSTNILDPKEVALLDYTPTNSVTTHKHHLQPTFGYFAADGTVRSQVPDTDPVDVAMVTDRYVPNSTTAQYLIKTMTRWNSLSQLAEARVRGDATLQTGDTVAIRTGLSNTVVDDYDGMWFILSVEHRLDSTAFQTYLKLSRDQYRAPAENRSYRTFWSDDNRPIPALKENNGVWESSWRS